MAAGLLYIPDTLSFPMVDDEDTLGEIAAAMNCVVISGPAEAMGCIHYLPPEIEPLLWEGDNS